MIEIKRHEWLQDIKWGELEQKSLKAPYEINNPGHNFDKGHVEKPDEKFT